MTAFSCQASTFREYVFPGRVHSPSHKARYLGNIHCNWALILQSPTISGASIL